MVFITVIVILGLVIRGINPICRSNSSGYEYESFTSYEKPNNEKPNNEKPWKSSSFYASSNSIEGLTKKYCELSKIYHPDNITTRNAESFINLKD